MKATVKFFIYMGLIIIALYTSGCSDNKAKQNSAEKNVIALQQQEAGNQQLASVNNNDSLSADTTEVVLYFSDGNGKLAPERRKIRKVPGIARETINELCRGPQVNGLEATIPPNTSLLDINIQDGLCTINLSEELITEHSGGSAAENMTVYSLVNTLSQFQSIESVQILVEGKIVPTIAGHLDVSSPLERDPEIVSSI
ncbi:Sporulation and spore germination [Desulfotomaculum arcticum]|uniref:Sporulation and spore germination n=1 Tax=Desulfotruncus arcticus DSM 17038 TaxID=1121424 RepID=A0A1I2N6V9_9FIRM|nr:GerMN domain-containing protein [Desulfotruncus arcticus]SFF99333.1 Sporulation and spore germination [Desulfotomaculum arcticum] [Desulfotruncus arcticus DSM 17038]